MNRNKIHQYGDHLITNADICSKVVDEMARKNTVNVMYTDPPWGDGNLKYWTTINEKMTGDKFTPLTYDQLIGRLDELIKKYVKGYVFIETGLRWTDKFMDHFSYLHNMEVIELEYLSSGKVIKNPCIFGGTAPQFKFGHQLEYLRDAASVREILSLVTKAGDVVMDPCCGMGYTAQGCVDLGLKFRGNEFNTKRLGKTIARLEK
jgi:DNA modification methylase